MIHPLHLHRMHVTVIDQGRLEAAGAGAVRHAQRGPGELQGVIVDCDNPGT